MDNKVEVFISYAHADAELRQELDNHLANLKYQGIIKTWNDHKISAGAVWEEEVNRQLDAAHVILLLISPRFMASNHSYDVQMKRAMERHETGEACVIPVILKPVDFQDAPFSHLKTLPQRYTDVVTAPNQDAAFLDVVEGIKGAIKRVIEERKKLYLEDFKEAYRNDGYVSPLERILLSQRKNDLGFLTEEVNEIEAKYLSAMGQYEQVLAAQLEHLKDRGLPPILSSQDYQQMRKLQSFLNLEDEDIALIHEKYLQEESGGKGCQPLTSELDCSKLEGFLKEHKWAEADWETYLLMNQALNKQKPGYIEARELKHFPCNVLLEINQLWMKYSGGKFGFSIQREIWLNCSEDDGFEARRQTFAKQVGWVGDNNRFLNWKKLTFDITAPKGHLPVFYKNWKGGGWWWVSHLAERFSSCESKH